MKYRSSFVTAHQKRLLKKQRRHELKILMMGVTLMWLAMAIPLVIFLWWAGVGSYLSWYSQESCLCLCLWL